MRYIETCLDAGCIDDHAIGELELRILEQVVLRPYSGAIDEMETP